MANKFTDKINKNRPQTKLADLLADSKDDAFIKTAVENNKLLRIPLNKLVPDPNQPRKTFPTESLTALCENIEKYGQLQPILIGNPLADGTYPIIAGERRWRAASLSGKIDAMDAVIFDGDVDPLNLMIIQFSENAHREDVPVIEHARSVNAIVAACKSRGIPQKAVAALLGVDPSVLSKYLSIANAPIEITEISSQGESQDFVMLDALAKAHAAAPEEVVELLDQWREGELEGSLRAASIDLAKSAKSKDKAGKKKTTKKYEKLSSINMVVEDKEIFLNLNVGKKRIVYRLDKSCLQNLIDEVLKYEG